MSFIFFFCVIWFIAASKNVLFWLYLWQLKEYHIGRFLAHFQTVKGRKLLWNIPLLLKILFALVFLLGWNFWKNNILLLYIGISTTLFLVVGSAVVYFFESLWTVKNIFQKKLKIPVLTFKTVPLIFICFLFEIIVSLLVFQLSGNDLSLFILGLLLFDIFIPLIVSAIVLFFQPLAVLRKNHVIGKAIKKRKQFKDITVIGITGSLGKTSVKEFLAAILSQKFNVLKTQEHQNSEMGISECMLNELKPEHQVFIVEMGAYNRGGIKLLCKIAQPKIGILTGINEQHLAIFGSQEKIIKTKFELIESLPEDGAAILNYDNQYVKSRIQDTNYKLKVKNKKLYSVMEKPDIWAENILVNKDLVSFRVFLRNGESAYFHLNVLGKHNVINFLGAIGAAKELGMSLEEISKACEKIEKQQGGMVLKRSPLGMNVIDSTYSSNPDGVFSALEYLKVWPGRKAIIMPCLIELGLASKSVHKRIGEKIAEVCQLAIITTRDRFREIKKAAMEKGIEPGKIIFSENPKDILERIEGFNNENDIILLEGRISKEITGVLIKE